MKRTDFRRYEPLPAPGQWFENHGGQVKVVCLDGDFVILQTKRGPTSMLLEEFEAAYRRCLPPSDFGHNQPQPGQSRFNGNQTQPHDRSTRPNSDHRGKP
jgi:hypothetical protein